MKKIIIEKNKNKFYIYSVLSSVILVSTLVMSLYGFCNPSKYVYWFLPSEEFVFIVAIIGIVSSVIGIFLVFFNIINQKYYIEISDKGLFLGYLPYKNKFLKWNEIKLIEEKKINNHKYLIIFVHNVNKLAIEENFIGKFFLIMNLETQGTPYLINCSIMSCSFEDLFRILLSYWEKYGNDNAW